MSQLFHHLIDERKKVSKNVKTRIERKIVIDFKLMKFDNLIQCQWNENTIQTQISSVKSYFLEPFITTKDDKKVETDVESVKEKYDARNETFEEKGDLSRESLSRVFWIFCTNRNWIYITIVLWMVIIKY